MFDAWVFAGQPALSGLVGTTVTLVEGTSFAISTASGDIDPGGPQGLFYRDTRYLSTWRLRVDDQPVQMLAVVPSDPFAARFLGRLPPRVGQADSTLFVVRERLVGDGMREGLVLRNLGGEATACLITVEVDADFAHLFDVKEGRAQPRGDAEVAVTESALVVTHTFREQSRRITVVLPPGARAEPGLVTLEAVVPARAEWRACFEVNLEMDGEPVEPRYRCGEPVDRSAPVKSLRSWEQTAPSVKTDDEDVDRTFARSIPDLGVLRIFDPDEPGTAVLAAGAPWFMTLFGRDSLVTSWMTLGVDPTIAVGTLLTLARYQGERVEPRTEEEPGRILHEMRSGLTGAAGRGEESVYYGSIDSTPLFVMLLGELLGWGVDDSVIDRLLPHADRALDWIEHYGDRDGDGFVEYQRRTDRGLVNQGWKDSFDGVNFANGRIAEPPIALCEVQGYVYAAYLARARLARARGDAGTAERFTERARLLKGAFNERFWLADRGCLAVGLDGDKRPIDSLTSNMGHCLWTGIVEGSHAASVAARLLSAEMFTGWGVRTLASSMGAYNPVSYHNGSVWPHDGAICAAGLMRYGFVAEAQRIARGLFDVATAFDGRLPELLCGFAREEFAVPVGYPTSCSPQAWASATPLSLLRTLLRLDPAVDEGTVRLAPQLPASFGAVRIENVPIGRSRVTIEAEGTTGTVRELGEGLRLVAEPRPVDAS
ncbi:MAG: glycogen debranching N-terminal domain-containing protein [Acidimicrobiales bacterium]|jgi:glycogen debranching enzyme